MNFSMVSELLYLAFQNLIDYKQIIKVSELLYWAFWNFALCSMERTHQMNNWTFHYSHWMTVLCSVDTYFSINNNQCNQIAVLGILVSLSKGTMVHASLYWEFWIFFSINNNQWYQIAVLGILVSLSKVTMVYASLYWEFWNFLV